MDSHGRALSAGSTFFTLPRLGRFIAGGFGTNTRHPGVGLGVAKP